MGREANNTAASAPAMGFAVRRVPARDRRRLLIRGGLVTTIVLVLAAGGWWLRTSSVFSVQRVESGSYRFTSQQELEGVFGSLLGRNIWTLSGTTVADSLAGLPWVRDLQVRRRLPGSIQVDFREWRPLLVLENANGGAPEVVVEDGRVLRYPDHLLLPGLPVLVGVALRPDPETGGRVLDPEVKETVLALVAAVEASGLESCCPVDFIVARSEGFAIVLQDGMGSLLVGREDFTARLERFMSARDHLEAGLQMDLRFADRITCRRI
jgi:cell division septal protein FtsQ